MKRMRTLKIIFTVPEYTENFDISSMTDYP